MKKLLFIIVLFLVGNIAAQQELWPKANAEWYYTNSDDMQFFGFTHYKIERDTSLLGKNCQIYSRENKTLFTGLPFDTVYHHNEDIYYIIGLEDSVLYNYSFDRNEFDTIINFKATVGDMWKNYYLSEQCTPNEGEPYFWTRVLNKETEIVNGLELLKFTFERTVPGENTFTTDVFYQLIGGMNGNFIYNKICFASDFFVESILRCFSYHLGESDEYNYKTVEDCENISQLDVNDENKLNKINFVNPVLDNLIRINNLGINVITIIKLYDNLGKEIKTTFQAEQNICIITPEKLLTTGIYFCSIELNNGQKQTLKISIQN